jgi:proton glutamate symport protein
MHITDQLVEMIPTNYIKSALDQDMLATVILALFLGMAIVALDSKRTQPFLQWIDVIQSIAMKIIEWAMKLAPIAVFGLICNITMRVGFGAIAGMAAYVGTVGCRAFSSADLLPVHRLVAGSNVTSEIS